MWARCRRAGEERRDRTEERERERERERRERGAESGKAHLLKGHRSLDRAGVDVRCDCARVCASAAVDETMERRGEGGEH